MADIRINRDDGAAAFEKHLAEGSLGESLVIPKDLTEGGSMGVSLAFAQFLLTWSRASPNARTIKTYLPADDKEEFRVFASRAHNLAAAYFCDKLYADKTETDIRQLVLSAASPRIQAMYRAELDQTARGPEVEMVFVQGAASEFHGSFYGKAPSASEILEPEAHGRLIRGPEELNEFVAKCSRKLSLPPSINAFVGKKGSPFGCLLYEAFRNTAEHGYLASDGTRLRKNFRCVKLARSMSNREHIADMTVSAPQSQALAREYFDRLSRREVAAIPAARAQFFEMSIFDSGPGLAATIQRSTGSPTQTDVDAVVKCFGKHKTAKASPMAGLGLNRMLGAVHETGGFLRIRTSGVEAFFAGQGGLTPDTDPRHYIHGGLKRMEGTLVTVGIPMIY